MKSHFDNVREETKVVEAELYRYEWDKKSVKSDWSRFVSRKKMKLIKRSRNRASNGIPQDLRSNHFSKEVDIVKIDDKFDIFHTLGN